MSKVSLIVVSARLRSLISMHNYILSQKKIPDEVIIIWNGNSEDYEHLVCALKESNTRIITSTTKNISKLRNLGWKEAAYKLIAFTDDDCFIDRFWLEELTLPFEDLTVQATGSIRTQRNGLSPIAFLWQLSYISVGDLSVKYAALGKDPYLCTSSAVFRKEVLMELGGFCETLVSGEDFELSKRMKQKGMKIVLCKNATVEHEHPNTLAKLFKQQVWYGRGRYQLSDRRGLARLFDLVWVCKEELILTNFKCIVFLFKYKYYSYLLLLPGFVFTKCMGLNFGMLQQSAIANSRSLKGINRI